MPNALNRRELLGQSALLAAGLTLGSARPQSTAAAAETPAPAAARKFKLGLVTYNLASTWDLDTCLSMCRKTGMAAIEFRTQHQHGVEPTLTPAQRAEVRKKCEDAGVIIWGPGSACDYHSADPAVVQKNIDLTRQFIELAHDLGARGVKVRPNGISEELGEEKTLEQIGRALHTVGEFAKGAGIEICCEVHGKDTSHPPRMRKIMDIANHPNVGVTWNSNGSDVKNGSVKEYFELLRPKIYSCHINELTSGYPYRELFALMNATGYDRFTMIEAQALETKSLRDIERYLRMYKALWEEWSRPA